MSHKKKTATEAIQDEHICMQRDRRILNRELAKSFTEESFHDWKMEFLWRLRDFRFHVANHIDLEEDGGFMSEIVEMAPEKDTQIKKLAKEHEGLLDKIDQLINELRPLTYNDNEKLDMIRTHLKEMLRTMDRHESEENELIQSVFYQDYGFSST